MEQTLLWVLGLFSLNLLFYCGQAEVVLTVEPNWSVFFHGESVTLICDVKEGQETDWWYSFNRDGQRFIVYSSNKKHQTYTQYIQTGNYSCTGDNKRSGNPQESKKVHLTVLVYTPKALILEVNSSTVGAVMLTCSVSPSTPGWEYSWYSGTNAQPLTAGDVVFHSNDRISVSQDGLYRCAGGRGTPRYYTVQSDTFVAITPVVKLNHNWPEVFYGEETRLTCEMKGGENVVWEYEWMKQQVVLPENKKEHVVVHATTSDYMCRAESTYGQTRWSKAFRLTVIVKDILLESPTHPVAEGEAVTLRCKLKTGNFVADVFFYQNDKVVQNDTRWTLTIPAVSKSHEGFYRCEGKYSQRTLTSPQSWISVKSVSKPEHSPGHMPLIVGLVCGVLVIIPLLLLLVVFCYRMSKENKETFSSSEYASPQHDDACHYETVKPRVDTEDDEVRGVVYSLIEIKKRHEINGEKSKPDKGCVYSDLKIQSDADDDQMYAQVQSCSKDKKNNKRQSTPAVAEETVYSEINPGKSSDQ
uniref:Fc receptor-like protein 4 isoform X3 n=1 Tax=Solea senegalensis TaxID=28829 RepID=UPI001CD8D1DC|nr:Fc receptor-like protein 4 isoform X3 [Solea senegalensis]